MVRSKFEMCPSSPLGQAHVLEALRVQALLLPRQVREVLRGDRRPRGDRRTPTPRAAWASAGSLALREPRQRPDLHQRLLRSERAEPVRGRAAVHRQHEVVREAVEERQVDPLRVELVEVGDVVAPRPGASRTTASLSVRFQVAIASVGSAGSSMSRRPSAMRTSSAWHHPGHAVAHRAQVLDVGVDEGARVERRAVAQPEPRRG